MFSLMATYSAPDCEQIGDYKKNVDRNWKDKQGLWLLSKNCATGCKKFSRLDKNIARVDVKEPCTFSAAKPA